jgi:hypothetical protein
VKQFQNNLLRRDWMNSFLKGARNWLFGLRQILRKFELHLMKPQGKECCDQDYAEVPEGL